MLLTILFLLRLIAGVMPRIASNPQQTFPSIAAALKACTEDDTIYLRGRDYEEDLEFDKPVRLAKASEDEGEVPILFPILILRHQQRRRKHVGHDPASCCSDNAF